MEKNMRIWINGYTQNQIEHFDWWGIKVDAVRVVLSKLQKWEKVYK